jgi:hypothetical protein
VSWGFDLWWRSAGWWPAASWPRRAAVAVGARRRAGCSRARARRGYAWELRGALGNVALWLVWLERWRPELAPCGLGEKQRRRRGLELRRPVGVKKQEGELAWNSGMLLGGPTKRGAAGKVGRRRAEVRRATMAVVLWRRKTKRKRERWLRKSTNWRRQRIYIGPLG